jgi:hypothetical protein
MRIERRRKIVECSQMQARLILGENWLPMRCSRWNICERSRGDKNRYHDEQHWRSSAHEEILA